MKAVYDVNMLLDVSWKNTVTFKFSASSQPCALKNLTKHLYKHFPNPNTKYIPISLKQSFTYVKRSTSFAETCQSKKIRLPAYFVFYCLFSRKYLYTG